MNKVLIPLLVVSLVGNAYFFFQIQNNGKSIEPSQGKVSPKPDGVTVIKSINKAKPEQAAIIQDLSVKLNKLRASLANLEKENQDLEDQLMTLKASGLSQENPSTEIAESQKASAKSERTIEGMRKDRENRMARFESEVVNQEWAYPIQSQLSDIIGDSELLSQMSVSNITCKTTICRVSVTPLQEGVGAKIGTYFELSQLLHENDQFKDYNTSSHHDETTKDVYVYITRPDSEG